MAIPAGVLYFTNRETPEANHMGGSNRRYERVARRLGIEVTRARQELGLTQAVHARRAGLRLKYVAMIERGTNPSLRTLLKLGAGLGMTPCDLIERMRGREEACIARRVPPTVTLLRSDDPGIMGIISMVRRLSAEERVRALAIVRRLQGR